ncbi:hypothetical protein QQF64_016796 [Cirrhinus molitorella]|uniref:Secreted protein n=1 Tax=Cirrhinus molitorella TaxID=172907 RepID=A0ABR3LNT7_9TELE
MKKPIELAVFRCVIMFRKVAAACSDRIVPPSLSGTDPCCSRSGTEAPLVRAVQRRERSQRRPLAVINGAAMEKGLFSLCHPLQPPEVTAKKTRPRLLHYNKRKIFFL